MCDVVHARRKRFAATVEVGCAVASAMGSRGQGRATRRAAIWHEPAIEATAARRTRSCLLVNTCNVSQDVDPRCGWVTMLDAVCLMDVEWTHVDVVAEGNIVHRAYAADPRRGKNSANLNRSIDTRPTEFSDMFAWWRTVSVPGFRNSHMRGRAQLHQGWLIRQGFGDHQGSIPGKKVERVASFYNHESTPAILLPGFNPRPILAYRVRICGSAFADRVDQDLADPEQQLLRRLQNGAGFGDIDRCGDPAPQLF